MAKKINLNNPRWRKFLLRVTRVTGRNVETKQGKQPQPAIN